MVPSIDNSNVKETVTTATYDNPLRLSNVKSGHYPWGYDNRNVKEV